MWENAGNVGQGVTECTRVVLTSVRSPRIVVRMSNGISASDGPAVSRFDSLHAVWSWLPAFRAVAETQHVGKAAKLLRVTPPAVSRTVRLLEDYIGAQLFSRAGRQLVLNSAGAPLLAPIREAMRPVEAGL